MRVTKVLMCVAVYLFVVILTTTADESPVTDSQKACKQPVELTDAEFTPLFNGRDLTGWHGDTQGYVVEQNRLVCSPTGKNLYTDEEFADFVLRFEFKLAPGANNGIGLRVPRDVTWASAEGIELQILDDNADQYRDLKPTQYHGSVYGFVAAKRGALQPLGEWNEEEVVCTGRQIRVKLNDQMIVNEDNVDRYPTDPAPDGEVRPGLKRTSGHIGLLGHQSRVEFRNIRIRPMQQE